MDLTLRDAQQLLLAQTATLPAETIALAHGLHRVTATALYTASAKPGFAQSARDGFAVGPPAPGTGEQEYQSFRIIGEIAAGSAAVVPLGAGEALRIMTGAMIAPGTQRVIPLESTSGDGAIIRVESSVFRSSATHIRDQGCDLASGSRIAPAGTALLPEHLLLLAEDGWQTVAVHRRPTVAVLCTGSELVESGAVQPGQKISGNKILLASLLAEIGAECWCAPPLPDELGELTRGVLAALEAGPDLIITTGGMGPGKYDLLEKVFQLLGGQPFYRTLRVRPGKATLAGRLAGTLFLGLPGPPPAVRLLFPELVEPVVRKLSGYVAPLPLELTAQLTAPIFLSGQGLLTLKAGVARIETSQLRVRAAAKFEPFNAIMLLPGEVSGYEAGTTLTIHGVRRWGSDVCLRPSST